MKKLIIILIGIVVLGCSSPRILQTDNTALVALSASTSYIGGSGNGMIIVLKNMDTGEKYEAKKLSHFSSHSIIQNIKPGKYKVEKITLDTGGNSISNWSENVHNYFGLIEIEGNKKYYLGTFKGIVKIKFKNAISLKLVNQDVPEKIISYLEEHSKEWASGEFIKIETIRSEELIIY